MRELGEDTKETDVTTRLKPDTKGTLSHAYEQFKKKKQMCINTESLFTMFNQQSDTYAYTRN
jgi:hypothetical protein